MVWSTDSFPPAQIGRFSLSFSRAFSPSVFSRPKSALVTLPTGGKLEVDFRGSFKMEGQKITARYIELIADGTHCLHEAVFDLNEKTNTFSFRKFV